MSGKSCFVASLLSALFLSFPVFAGAVPIEHKPVVRHGLKPVLADLALADRLADYGRARKDALALIEAARIRVRIGGHKVTRKSSGQKAGAKTVRHKKGRSRRRGPDSVESLLKAARRMGQGSEIVEALIAEVESAGSKGRSSGPKYSPQRVGAQAVEKFLEKFIGGKVAEVVISGDGGADLDLYIYDSDGHQVCKDDDPSDKSYCIWYPKSTASFEIRIRNRGEVYGKYVLTTN